MIEECFSKDFITIQLHATAELMSLFFSKDIKLEDCCKELNINDFQTMISLALFIVLINNFSEQKDENYDLTRNDEYIKDNFDAFDFRNIKVINGNKNPKNIIKEVRDAFEHKSFYIHKSGKVYVENQRTGFKALIGIPFICSSFVYFLNANNVNGFLLDDRNINYNDNIENILDNLNMYRIIAKSKNKERNMDGIFKQNLQKFSESLTFNDQYKYVKIKLNKEERQALINFFQGRKINKETLYTGLTIIKNAGTLLSNRINFFVFNNFATLKGNDTRHVVKKYLNQTKSEKSIIDEREFNVLKTLFQSNKFCENYFKLLYTKYVIGNLDFEMSEESTHIRNCLAHAKYSWLNSDEILLKDHPNGVNNEDKITFEKKYNIEELYNLAKELWFYTMGEQIDEEKNIYLKK